MTDNKDHNEDSHIQAGGHVLSANLFERLDRMPISPDEVAWFDQQRELDKQKDGE
jgi:hypothetical protein